LIRTTPERTVAIVSARSGAAATVDAGVVPVSVEVAAAVVVAVEVGVAVVGSARAAVVAASDRVLARPVPLASS
jgi:hypothetical protein